VKRNTDPTQSFVTFSPDNRRLHRCSSPPSSSVGLAIPRSFSLRTRQVFFHVKPENLDLKIILATHAYNGIEVRYWRLEKLRSFDKFLTRRFPESRRKGSPTHVNPRVLALPARKELKEMGSTKGLELAKSAGGREGVLLCNPAVETSSLRKDQFKREAERYSGKELELFELI
jgi:hypothetical protein